MESSDYLRFVLALAFVLSLMGICAHLAKRYGWGSVTGPRPGRRLSVLETRQLDGRHKLMLVKCDDREHLILLSPDGQTVVEANVPPRVAA